MYAYANNNPLRWVDPEGLDITVIVNNNTPITGTHTGLYNSSILGNVLYDPGGSYRNNQKGSGDTLYGPEANLADYLGYQRRDGPHVQSFIFPTTLEEDRQIQGNIDKQGGCMPLLCSTCTGNVLRGIGPFRNLGSTLTPAGLARELHKLQRQ